MDNKVQEILQQYINSSIDDVDYDTSSKILLKYIYDITSEQEDILHSYNKNILLDKTLELENLYYYGEYNDHEYFVRDNDILLSMYDTSCMYNGYLYDLISKSCKDNYKDMLLIGVIAVEYHNNDIMFYEEMRRRLVLELEGISYYNPLIEYKGDFFDKFYNKVMCK